MSIIRGRILYDLPYWAYYWRAKALQKYCPEDMILDIGNNYGTAFKKHKHDFVLQLAYSYADQLRSHMTRGRYNFPLISSYNVGWNYCNKWLDSCRKHSDVTVINNREMWEKYGKHSDTVWISNGVDRTKFYPIKDSRKKAKEKILWIGSEFHRKTKNYDSVLVPLKNRLKAMNIECDFRVVDSGGKNRMNQEQMNKWYSTGTMYVVASKTEGTPNPALEAASCGLPVIATRVGNMPELIKDGYNGYLADPTVDDLFSKIMKVRQNRHVFSDNMLTEIESWDWKYRSNEFYKLFRQTVTNYAKEDQKTKSKKIVGPSTRPIKTQANKSEQRNNRIKKLKRI